MFIDQAINRLIKRSALDEAIKIVITQSSPVTRANAELVNVIGSYILIEQYLSEWRLH